MGYRTHTLSHIFPIKEPWLTGSVEVKNGMGRHIATLTEQQGIDSLKVRLLKIRFGGSVG